MNAIQAGDTVVCLLPPAVNPAGQPAQRPKLGERYVVAQVYAAPYGWGIQLEGLDPFPYSGYVLWASPDNSLGVAGGWYFAKLTSFGVASKE